MPKFTNYTQDFHGTLDHILYNSDRLEATLLLEIPEINDVRREIGLPSTLYPSDHIRIEAILILK